MNEIESKMPTDSNYEGKRVKRKFGLRYTTVKESTLSLNCAERSLNLPGRSLFKYSMRSTDGAQESQQLCDCVCSVLLHHSYQKQSTGRNISENVSCEMQLVRVWLSQGRRQTGSEWGVSTCMKHGSLRGDRETAAATASVHFNTATHIQLLGPSTSSKSILSKLPSSMFSFRMWGYNQVCVLHMVGKKVSGV